MNPNMVFVDLETTGATATHDRITEIGIVDVGPAGVREWASLVNPERRIPEFIQHLTGITDDLVADARPFASLAQDVFERLQGRLFIAHNARFDYAFLKNEFKRAGYDFRATMLCTVQLSRKLYPQHRRHNLDALIERHGLDADGRHRALADARLIWQFWQRLAVELDPDSVTAAVKALTARPSLPAELDADVVDRLPEGHGVYLFYGDNELPLYIGKSRNIKKRVLAHFAADHSAAKEMSLARQVRRIDCIETAGELGALLQESVLVKRLQPSFNRRLRRNEELCSWRLVQSDSDCSLELLLAGDDQFARAGALYGLFASRRQAKQALTAIADEHGLCHALLGLEKATHGRPCFSHQLKCCQGACAGKEPRLAHAVRLISALAPLRLAQWPYEGAVGIREGETLHVIDRWRYLGSASSDEALWSVLDAGPAVFDADIYKLLAKSIGRATVVPLLRNAAAHLSA